MVAMVSTLVLCFQLFVILRLYIKHKKKSDAENLFEINFLVDIFVTLLIFTCFLPLEDLFSGFSCLKPVIFTEFANFAFFQVSKRQICEFHVFWNFGLLQMEELFT